MDKTFIVQWIFAGLEYDQVCSGYADACQLCAKMVKNGIYPQIVIQYNAEKTQYTEDWQPESRDRAIAQNGNDGLHYNKEKK